MKENQNKSAFDSISFGQEIDPLTFEGKDRCELNDSRMDANHTELEAKDRDDCLNFKDMDASSMDSEKGTMDSPKKAGQNGLSRHLSMDNGNGTVDSPRNESKEGLSHHLIIWDKDADSISSDSSDIDKEHRCPDHESLDTVEEFADCNGSNSRDSSSPLFTDKNVMDCDPPELEVFYKEIDSQILKDICVDEGRPQKDVNVIEICKDEEPGCLFTQPPNDIGHFDAKEDSSPDAVSFAANQCRSEEENEGNELISQSRLDSCLENSLEIDTVEQCEKHNAEETGVSYFAATDKAENDSSKDNSIVNRKLPIEDIDTQSLGLDGGNKVTQVPIQNLNQVAAPPESPAASSADAEGTKEDVQASCLVYNSKVEMGSITFNFRTPEGAVAGNAIAEDAEEQPAELGDVHKDVNSENLPDASKEKAQCTSDRVGAVAGNGIAEDVEEQSAESGDVHKDLNSENLPDASEEKVHCTSDRVEAVPGNGIAEDVEEQSAESGDVHKDVNSEDLPDASEEKVQCTSDGVGDSNEHSLIINEGNSDGGSATIYVQSVRSEDSSCESDHEGSPRHKCDDVSIDAPVQSPTNKSPAPTNDVLASEPNAPNHERKDSGEVPAVSRLQHDMGETSFSAASRIAFSGPIAFSGSLSHRSDGSTTSGKSFAFPVLQTEWPDSPVRMAKAERRHFRKHKGWRSGLLCCRF